MCEDVKRWGRLWKNVIILAETRPPAALSLMDKLTADIPIGLVDNLYMRMITSKLRIFGAWTMTDNWTRHFWHFLVRESTN